MLRGDRTSRVQAPGPARRTALSGCHELALTRRLRRLRRAAYGAWFDWRGGVETTAEVAGSEHVGDRHVYQPADVWRLPGILPARDVSPDDVLVDVGSGKGRVVLFAVHRYPFRRIIGVEVSAELHAVAERNLDTLDTERRSRVELCRGDVSHWPLPDDTTVLHLFNPFGAATLRAFLAEVAASQRRRPRLVRMVYIRPVLHGDVVAAGFDVLRSRPGFTLYRRLPQL